MTDVCRVRATHHMLRSQQTVLTSKFTMLVCKTQPIIVFTYHVERPSEKLCRLVHLRYLPLNGVETSLHGYRCFDSVDCELTTLFVNRKDGARVAQHDKVHEDVLNCEAVSSNIYFCDPVNLHNAVRLCNRVSVN
jgi:hypothetical protein